MIATTKKQSRMLINAGCNPETADMCYVKMPYTLTVLVAEPPHDICDAIEITPAWSLSALWNLCRKLAVNFVFLTESDTPEEMIEMMVDHLVKLISYIDMNEFNKKFGL